MPMTIPSMAVDRAASVLYFFLFVSLGSMTPYLPVIWRSKGLSDDEIGVLAAVRPLALIFVGPLICAFGDKYGIQQEILHVLIVLFAITRSSVLIAGSFLTLAAVEASSSISQSPIVSLVDSSVRNSFGVEGYGSQRMWGAVGYGFAVLVSGLVYDNTGGGYGSVVIVFVAALAVALAAALRAPVGATDKPTGGEMDQGTQIEMQANGRSEPDETTSESEDTASTTSCGYAAGYDNSGHTRNGADEDIANGSPDIGDEAQRGTHEGKEPGVLSALWLMFSTMQNASFFASVALSGIGKGVIDTFLFVWLDDLGGSHIVLGLAGLVMCAAEVPFFYLSGPLIRKIGPRNVVALSQIGYLVRFGYYSVLQDPWWVLPVEVVHGLTFAAMWAATTDFAHRVAPAHMRTTMQANVSGLKRGLGYGLGAILGGVLYSSLGPRLCFRVCAALPSLSLLFLAIGSGGNLGGGRRWQENEEATEEGLEGWGERDSTPREHQGLEEEPQPV